MADRSPHDQRFPLSIKRWGFSIPTVVSLALGVALLIFLWKRFDVERVLDTDAVGPGIGRVMVRRRRRDYARD